MFQIIEIIVESGQYCRQLTPEITVSYKMKSKYLMSSVAGALFFIHHFSAYADVQVDIDLSEAEHHYAYVTMSFPSSEDESVDLHIPVWRTGRYEILNLANGIREFSANNNDNWHKIDKDTWRLHGDFSHGVEVRYQVYANQLGKRTRHVDDSHAFLDASAVVMYSENSRNDKHIISLNVPDTWRSVSGLNSGEYEHQFVAPNYDVLVDSPIETGINEFHQFEVDGIDYELVIWGKGNYDSAQMVKDLKAMVGQGKTIWSDYPFSRYVFMVHATSGAHGATEHLNSTIIQRSRYSFSERKDYLAFLSTAAHEYVHTWNVKQYRPQGLVPYDYQHENYSNLLWLAEGSTSYLQNQLLMRGKLMTSKEWLKSLSERIDGYMRKPGRDVQSVADSSFNKWISESGDYSKNHSVNIYSEGFLVSWILDFDILKQTKLKKSYRNVHNLLSKEYAIPKTFNDENVKQLLQKVTGKDYQKWWQKNIDGLAKPDFNTLLANAGLEISYGEKSKQTAWTGITGKKHDSGVIITAVEKGSVAWDAGLTTDDIVVAIDGLRVKRAELTTRLKNFKPGQEIPFTFFRRDQLMTKTIALAEQPAEKLKVIPMKKPSKAQKSFFKAWTGLDFPELEKG
jgi:predicted metalloprotease with PDZ domain